LYIGHLSLKEKRKSPAGGTLQGFSLFRKEENRQIDVPLASVRLSSRRSPRAFAVKLLLMFLWLWFDQEIIRPGRAALDDDAAVGNVQGRISVIVLLLGNGLHDAVLDVLIKG
jgi:hypothetical protein